MASRDIVCDTSSPRIFTLFSADSASASDESYRKGGWGLVRVGLKVCSRFSIHRQGEVEEAIYLLSQRGAELRTYNEDAQHF
jgi:hypothetical protein